MLPNVCLTGGNREAIAIRVNDVVMPAYIIHWCSFIRRNLNNITTTNGHIYGDQISV
jgi:hypothetical protein